MKMRCTLPIFSLLFLFLWACQPDAAQEQEIDIASPIEKEEPTTTENSPDSSAKEQPIEESEVEKAALSFHRWYLNHINNYESEVPTDAFVVEGKDGKCKLEMEPYFEELRKLGTISEVFIEQEKARLSLCAEEMEMTDWEACKEGQVCDMLTYFYWINSQETMEFVDAERSELLGDSAAVWVRFYDVFKEKKIYWEDHKLKTTLALEDSVWRITGMGFL